VPPGKATGYSPVGSSAGRRGAAKSLTRVSLLAKREIF
jgi:hypothetical protein